MHLKIRRPKPYQLIFAFWVALDGFDPLLSTQLTTDLLGSVVVDLCFCHCDMTYERILFIDLKQFQSALWIDDALLFLIDCKRTRSPFRTELSHAQLLIQNGEYTSFWYLWGVSYLTQLQFTHDIQIFPLVWKLQTVPDYEIVCLFLRHAKQRKEGGWPPLFPSFVFYHLEEYTWFINSALITKVASLTPQWLEY